MQVDSKTVAKELRKAIKPILKDHGFMRGVSRTFWKDKNDRIEVVGFQTMGNILHNLPSASFVLHAGIYFREYSDNLKVKEKDSELFPKESECIFRLAVKKNIVQSYGKYDRADTWIITNDESLSDCIGDVCSALEKQVFPFFDTFESDDEIIRFLVEEQVNFEGGYTGIFGVAGLGSPKRKKVTALMALLLGKK